MTREMRRKDREIKDFEEILDILKRANTIRLGLNGDPYPYVVPVSFGFEALDGAGDGGGAGETGGTGGTEGTGGACLALYIHGAAVGQKCDLIKRDAHVCVEADIFNGYLKQGEGENNTVTALFESVVAYGTAALATDAEAERGMALMLDHCGYPDFIFTKADLARTAIYKITITRITGKRNPA